MKTFRCGHEKTEENSRFTKGFSQCKTCERDRARERRERMRRLRAIGEVPASRGRSNGKYRHLSSAPSIFADDGSAAKINQGSASLLRAIYRAHPYVFDAAERAGRMAVRP